MRILRGGRNGNYCPLVERPGCLERPEGGKEPFDEFRQPAQNFARVPLDIVVRENPLENSLTVPGHGIAQEQPFTATSRGRRRPDCCG